jgi:hypothetical protein
MLAPALEAPGPEPLPPLQALPLQALPLQSLPPLEPAQAAGAATALAPPTAP